MAVPQFTVARECVDRLYLIFQNTITGAKLFISDIYASQNVELLHQHDIKLVVNACYNVGEKEGYVEYTDIDYIKLELMDEISAEIRGCVENSIHVIHQQLNYGYNVLVHCQAGKSRSATIIAAYILFYHAEFVESLQTISDNNSSKVETVLNYMAKLRPGIQPNPRFMAFLLDFSSG